MSDLLWNDPALEFEGDFVFLRKLWDEDCNQRYLSWLNDPEVNKFSQRKGHTYTMDDVTSYVKEMNKPGSSSLMMGIFWKENSLHLGNVLLGPIDQVNKNAEISNMIGEKEYWGKRVAVDADKQLIDYAFKKLKLHKITIGNLAPNRGATFMSRQLGFKPEGTLKEQAFYDDGFVDILRFGLFEDDFYNKFPDMKQK